MFRRIGAPSAKELEGLIERIAERIGRALEREGLLVRDYENSYLSLDPAAGGPIDDLLGHSITYCVAMGPRAGQKVFTLQAVPTAPPEEQKKGRRCGTRLAAAERPVPKHDSLTWAQRLKRVFAIGRGSEKGGVAARSRRSRTAVALDC